jgi:hypothetical protein
MFNAQTGAVQKDAEIQKLQLQLEMAKKEREWADKLNAVQLEAERKAAALSVGAEREKAAVERSMAQSLLKSERVLQQRALEREKEVQQFGADRVERTMVMAGHLSGVGLPPWHGAAGLAPSPSAPGGGMWGGFPPGAGGGPWSQQAPRGKGKGKGKGLQLRWDGMGGMSAVDGWYDDDSWHGGQGDFWVPSGY